MRELVELEAIRPELEALQVELIVLAAEEPAALRELAAKRALGARFLADPEARELRRLGLVHDGAGPGGRAIALPTQLLLDAEGEVLWSFRSTDVRERHPAAATLAAVRERIAP
ncbi:MAG: redoxin domain-containing protein [Planctomycetes bacterium]|nr:redoxin domain-containing protein [Planctomycetota bacterium]